MRLFYRKKMLENRHFLIGIFQHFTTVADTLKELTENSILESAREGLNIVKQIREKKPTKKRLH